MPADAGSERDAMHVTTAKSIDPTALRAIIAAGMLFVSSCALAKTWIISTEPGSISIGEVAQQAQDGDTVEIRAGQYDGGVAVWPQKRLTIRGIGARPIIRAGTRSAEAKGIWVIRQGDFTIENIEFRDARGADAVGSGIRLERGTLTVRKCVFLNNEIGLMTANTPSTRLTIEDSEFGNAPTDAGGLHHLVYVGRIESVEVRGSYFHTGHVGHLFKSRARQSTLKYNLLADGPDGEASYELDFPNGGEVLVVGNTLVQGMRSQNRVVIAFGAEGNTWDKNRLQLAHNTLVNESFIPAWFLRVWRDRFASPPEIVAVNNLTSGLGIFEFGNDGVFVGNANRVQTLDHGRIPPSAASLLALDAVRPAPDPALRPDSEFAPDIGEIRISAPTQWVPGAFQATGAADNRPH